MSIEYVCIIIIQWKLMNVSHMLTNRVKSMTESATIKMSQKARDLKNRGLDVISLSLGEPDFDTPQHIKEAAWQALQDGYTKYTPVPGLLEYRTAIQQKFKRDNKLDYTLDEIIVSNGAKQSISNIIQAIVEEGDEVIIFTPYWVSYHDIVLLAGGTVIPLKAGIDQDFKVTPEQLQAAITPRTKAILFSSPCNPTGSVFTKEEIERLADVIAANKNILVISDEIYEYINFGEKHYSIGAVPSIADRVATVNGMAKGFAMTGWRLGYMGGPKWLVKACAKLQGQVTSGANAFGQMAAAKALMTDMGPTEAMKAAFRKRRELVIELFADIEGVVCNHPKGAFYVFPDISSFFGKSNGHVSIDNSEDFCEAILENAHVALVPGAAFGDDNCFRLSYAASEDQLREAIRRIAAYLKNFK